MTNAKSAIKKECDILFSKMVRSRGICELAGKDLIKCGGVLQCMHIVSRSNMHLRYDEQNALSGCQGHHVYYTHHPMEFYELIRKYYPERYNYIVDNKNTIKKIDWIELRNTLKSYVA